MQGQETDRTKMGAADYIVWCAECGDRFYATRSDASYCSAACRMRASREPGNRAKYCDRIVESANAAYNWTQQRGRNRDPQVFEALQAAAKILGAAAALCEEAAQR